MSRPTVIGGKLKLKGSGGPAVTSNTGASKKRKPEEVEKIADKETVAAETLDSESHLTATEKRHMQKKQELEARTMKKLSGMTYRERVEAFNGKLSTMTEHNDIPRISAAGNG